jgi:nitrate/TMAO reductase-like tetraheme cytochrome c subunit
MDNKRPNVIVRAWRGLRSPSARWSVLSLLVIGLLVGASGVIGTQVMVHVTGTNEFCGTACHSMQWTYAEFKQSGHHFNRSGVAATCHDCHIPNQYPNLLWYKAKAGTKDAIAEMRGVIDTEEKFKKERLRLAKAVWAEYKANDSANCRTCHVFTPEVIAKQKDFAKKMHETRKAENKTCIDCHKGVAHAEPEE